MSAPRTAVIPDVVVDELREGAARDDRVRAALDATWIEHRELRTDEEILAFAHFSAPLVCGTRNRGEAAVLALASTVPNGVAVVDDGVAARAGERAGVPVRRTLALLCEAIRSGLLTVRLVSALADDLLDSEYRLPLGRGGFEKWAADNGML